MRCAKCSGFVTPDLSTCPACGAPVGEPKGAGSPGDRQRQEIRREWDSWRKGTYGSPTAVPGAVVAGSSPGPSPASLLRGDSDSSAVLPIDAKPLGFLNFLLLHAGISPFLEIAVDPALVRGKPGASLRVRSAPAVIEPSSTPLTRAGGKDVFEPPSSVPRYEAFRALDEAVRAQLDLEVTDGAAVLASRSFQVTAQNPNEWINGFGVEAALAGVITPNAQAVVDALAALSGDWHAYQAGDPKRVRQEAARIYEGIARKDLNYIGVPPSFEGTGQKVLFPDELLTSRRGCCIDIATLTAAMLERVGLNPVLLMVEGHAFAGVWLSEIQARQPILRDAEVVAGAVRDGALLVWNSTSYFKGEDERGFETAEQDGLRYLSKFRYLLDVAACRNAGFKPVPRRT